jgi:ribosomal protein S17
MKIEKKAWPEFFQKIMDNVKTFDLRLDYFECNPGDVLVLREWDPKQKEYTGRILEKEISYVLKSKEISFCTEEDLKKYGF